MAHDLKKEVKELETAVEGSKFSAQAHHVLEGEAQEEDSVTVKQYKSKTVSNLKKKKKVLLL